jgi:hypothetical protein
VKTYLEKVRDYRVRTEKFSPVDLRSALSNARVVDSKSNDVVVFHGDGEDVHMRRQVCRKEFEQALLLRSRGAMKTDQEALRRWWG